MQHAQGKQETNKEFLISNLIRRDHLKKQDSEGKIVVKWIL
jgi:hypothetical protein